MEAWGAPEELLAASEETDFLVHPDNGPVIRWWQRISHLWNVGPMGGFIGLDWPRINARVQMIEQRGGEVLTLETLEGLELMERAALPLLNER